MPGHINGAFRSAKSLYTVRQTCIHLDDRSIRDFITLKIQIGILHSSISATALCIFSAQFAVYI